MVEKILEVKSLAKYFPVSSPIPFKKASTHVKAVNGVNFDVYAGETLGIVGESGCGKSTMARLVNQLIRPTEGAVFYQGKDLVQLKGEELRQTRKDIQMIFQDPYSSLDPRKKIGELIAEPMVIHKIGDSKYRKQKVSELLEIVGLNKRFVDRYPHEFSGGQRQRINIARALVLNPKIVICDEPVSALDVSVQAQVINLLKDLQNEFNLTYIFISHDLNVVRYMCDRIAVMYLGKIVEIGTYEEIYNYPQHPYTQALFSAIPKENPFEDKNHIILQGSVPSPLNPPTGCTFHERCPYAMKVCKEVEPETITNSTNHQAACHLLNNSRRAI